MAREEMLCIRYLGVGASWWCSIRSITLSTCICTMESGALVPLLDVHYAWILAYVQGDHASPSLHALAARPCASASGPMIVTHSRLSQPNRSGVEHSRLFDFNLGLTLHALSRLSKQCALPHGTFFRQKSGVANAHVSRPPPSSALCKNVDFEASDGRVRPASPNRSSPAVVIV
jgi:hypothetical protein